MHIVAETFWVPKQGNSPAEYEDAFFPKEKVECDTDAFSCAVADGATQSIFSGIWANLLVTELGPAELALQGFGKLPSLQNAWLESVTSKSLPWYVERKVQTGAFATLLGLKLTHSVKGGTSEGYWECVGAGDSCLFHVRRGELVCKYPLTEPCQFDRNPHLISSNPASNTTLSENTFGLCGKWEVDDYFFLMTDAIARWFITAELNGEKPWVTVCDLGLSDAIAFENWISELRQIHNLKNDDVTILVLNIT